MGMNTSGICMQGITSLAATGHEPESEENLAPPVGYADQLGMHRFGCGHAASIMMCLAGCNAQRRKSLTCVYRLQRLGT